MKHVRCVVLEDLEVGAFGLVPKIHLDWFHRYTGEPGAYLPATQLGHDILEHNKGDNGGLEHEFKALGAGVWVSKFYLRYGLFAISPEQSFMVNIETTIMDGHSRQELELEPSKKSPNFAEKGKLWEFFNAEYESLKNSLPINLSLDYESEDAGIGEETQIMHDWLDANKQTIFEWVAYGYWYASRKRYRGLDSYDVWLTRQAINKLKISPEFGFEYTISYDLQNGFAEFREHLIRDY